MLCDDEAAAKHGDLNLESSSRLYVYGDTRGHGPSNKDEPTCGVCRNVPTLRLFPFAKNVPTPRLRGVVQRPLNCLLIVLEAGSQRTG